MLSFPSFQKEDISYLSFMSSLLANCHCNVRYLVHRIISTTNTLSASTTAGKQLLIFIDQIKRLNPPSTIHPTYTVTAQNLLVS